MIRAFLILTFLFSQLAFARAGAGGSSGFRGEDIQGLCVPEGEQKKKMSCNKGSGEESIDDYVKDGYCQSIRETLEKPCVNELVEKLRQRYLNPDKEIGGKGKKGFSTRAMSCSPKDSDVDMRKIAKDPKKWKEELVQFMAANGILGSDQDVCAGVPDSPKNPVGASGDQAMGILKLKSKDMNDEKYSCGCKFTNEDDTGAADGHRSLVCGTYMALYWAEKDGTLYGGGSKLKDDQGKPTIQGAARIFPWLEDNDDNNGKTPPSLKLLEKKMDAFCDAKMGGKVRTRDEDLNRLPGGTSGGGADAQTQQ